MNFVTSGKQLRRERVKRDVFFLRSIRLQRTMLTRAIAVELLLALTVARFSPDRSDHDAYGIKIAGNDILFVQANNDDQSYLVQFAPYNYTNESLQCSPLYPASSSLHLRGRCRLLPNTQPRIRTSTTLVKLCLGEVDRQNGTFIAILINEDPLNVQSYVESGQSPSCKHFFTSTLRFLSSYGHQEYFVIAVEPLGRYAIGLATDFVFRYRPFSPVSITHKSSRTVWPNSSKFQPCAADASESFTIVAGFVKLTDQSRVRPTPAVHLLWNDNLTVLSSWTYTVRMSALGNHCRPTPCQ